MDQQQQQQQQQQQPFQQHQQAQPQLLLNTMRQEQPLQPRGVSGLPVAGLQQQPTQPVIGFTSYHQNPAAAVASIPNLSVNVPMPNTIPPLPTANLATGPLSPASAMSPTAPVGGYTGSPTTVTSPSYKTSTAALLLQQRQLQQQQQQHQQQQQQQQGLPNTTIPSPIAPQNVTQPLQPLPVATLVQSSGQGLVSAGTAPSLNNNIIALLPTTTPAGVGMNVITGQPLPSTALQQPLSASPTEQKPTSLQLLRQQQLELKEKEREREREREKEKERQQQQEQQQQEPKPPSSQASEPPNAQSTPFGSSPAVNNNVGSAAALATGAQGVKPETTSSTASLTRNAIKLEDEIMMPPPPPPSHANTNSQGGHETVPAAAAEPPTHIGTRSGTPSSSKHTVSAAEPSGPVQIFKATYSGVPVFEMICKGVAVMRRRSDSYLNATQILKVADFDKPQRTRILEREVQKGEHEKVQGGYGKYQGTWVPFERGIQLCQEYGVVNLLQPLLDYNTTQASPPLAPKHITAASNRPRKPREPRALGETPTDSLIKQRMKPKTKKMKQKGGNAQILPKPMGGSLGGVEGGASATGDEGEASMLATEDDDDDVDDGATSTSADDAEAGRKHRHLRVSQDKSSSAPRKRAARPGDELFIGYGENRQRRSRKKRNTQKSETGEDIEMESGSHMDDDDHEDDGMEVDDGSNFRRDHSPSVRSKTSRRSASRVSDQEDRKSTTSSTVATGSTSLGTASRGPYADALLEYFATDAEALPAILKEPPADMDFNIVIDDEGHTALHWAAAMAKVDVVKILIQHGADTYRVNTDGQTALMRSVLFSNNYDQKSFPVLLEMLQKTIFTIDKDDQTVFHHVTITAGQRGKVHAARYYLECLLQKLAQHPSELASIINVQDSDGETALTIAARLKIGGKKVVAMLVDAGADPKIRTRSGKNAEDYLVETGDAATAAATVPGNQAPPLHPFAKSSVKNTAPGTEAGGATRLQTIAKSSQPGTLTPQQLPSSTSSSSRRSNHLIDQRGSNQGTFPTHPLAPPPVGLLPPHQAAPTSTSTLYTQLQQANSTWPTGSAQLPGGASVGTTSQAVIPTVSNLFSRLTQSYERDIYEKDQDILEARNMLHGIQAEIREGQQTIQELKQRAVTLGQVEEQVRTLEEHIKQEIHTRQRLRLEELIGQEEERLRKEMGVTDKDKDKDKDMDTDSVDKGIVNGAIDRTSGGEDVHMKDEGLTTTTTPTLDPTATSAQEAAPQSVDGTGPGSTKSANATTATTGDASSISTTTTATTTTPGSIDPGLGGGDQAAGENLTDTTSSGHVAGPTTTTTTSSSLSPTPSSPSSKLQLLQTEVEQLREKLSQLQQQRKDRVNQIVQLKSSQGKRWYEYQRLIALCCNVSIDQVDDLLGPLLNSLGSKDEVENF
ncbi:hypothetical protein BGX34_010362 [Mortierella sp. NVP85]|nr:hypothetical protein BGX34_010362 [Mortierella sp. NVP85]